MRVESQSAELIAIAGRRDAGKSTLSEQIITVANQRGLEARAVEYGQQVIDLANRWRRDFPPSGLPAEMAREWVLDLAIPVLAYTGIGISRDQYSHLTIDLRSEESLAAHRDLIDYMYQCLGKPELIDGEITSDNKRDHRLLLEWLGSKLTLVDDDIWNKSVLKRIDGHLADGIDVVSAVSANYLANVQRLREYAREQHIGATVVRIVSPDTSARDPFATEVELDLIHPDVIVQNDSTIADLGRVATLILNHGGTWRRMAQPIELRASDEARVAV